MFILVGAITRVLEKVRRNAGYPELVVNAGNTEIEVMRMYRMQTPMLDGAKIGATLSGGINTTTELSRDSYFTIREILLRIVGKLRKSNEEGEAWVASGKVGVALEGVNKGASKMWVEVSLKERIDRVTGEIIATHFFNIKGNPISFITGQNVGGISSLTLVLGKVLEHIEKAAGAVLGEAVDLGEGIRAKFEAGDIHFNSLSFAAYSEPTVHLKKVAQLLKFLRYVYNNTVRVGGDGMASWSASGEAGFECNEDAGSNYPSLILKRKVIVGGRSTVVSHLTLYSKIHETRATSTDISEVAVDLLGKRLRFDLEIKAYGLQREGLKTLKAWQNRCDRMGMSSAELMQYLITDFMDKSGVLYAASFPQVEHLRQKAHPKLQAILAEWKDGKPLPGPVRKKVMAWGGLDTGWSYRFHLAAGEARARLGVDLDMVRAAEEGDSSALLATLKKGAADFSANRLAVQLSKLSQRLKPVELDLPVLVGAAVQKQLAAPVAAPAPSSPKRKRVNNKVKRGSKTRRET